MTELMSLHMVRSPVWMQQLKASMDRHIARNRPGWEARFTRPPEEIAEKLRSDAVTAHLLFDQQRKMMSFLGHLQWTLVSFPGDWLMTSDQPITAMPFVAPRSAVPLQSRWDNYPAQLEFRFAVDPRHAIVMSWRDEVDPGEPVELSYLEAVELNCDVSHEGDEVFWRPDSRPARILPPEVAPPPRGSPIAPLIYPGYRFRTAIRSQSWHEAQKLFRSFDDEDDELTTVQWRQGIDPEAQAA